MNTVADQLKEYRLLHHLTQEQMANRLGICREHYCRIEHGQELSSYGLLVHMAEVLGITFTIDSSSPKSSYAKDWNLPPAINVA